MSNVTFAVAFYRGMDYIPFAESLKDTVIYLKDKGHESKFLNICGCPYVGQARNYMTAQFLQDSDDDIYFSLDYDMSWKPEDALKLIESPHDISAVSYRYRREPEEYMAIPCTKENGVPIVCKDGTILSKRVPAGFAAIKRHVFTKMYDSYKDRMYTDDTINHEWTPRPVCDLWVTGIYAGKYWGEDFAFCRLWEDIGGSINIYPNVDISHWNIEDNKLKEYKGNYHNYLLTLPQPEN